MKDISIRRVAVRALLTLWVAEIVTLAVTTFFTDSEPYGEWWFVALWAVQAAALVAVMAATAMHRRAASAVTHAGVLLVIAAALLMAATSRRGTIVLLPGAQPVSTWVEDGTGRPRQLPEPVSLDSFVVVTHAGSAIPAGYVSHLRVGAEARRAEVSVGAPLSLPGRVRLYQSSYLPGGATVLSVSHDPWWSRPLLYCGFILIAAGMAAMMARRGSRWRAIIRSLGVGAMVIYGCADSLAAAPRGISDAQAAVADTMQVVYDGRVAPFSTPAAALLHSLSGRTSIGGRSAVRVAASIMLYPADWGRVALIEVKDARLRRALGMTGRLIAPDSLYLADGTYRLAELYGGGAGELDRAIADVDSRLALFRQAAEGSLVAPLQPGMRRAAPLRIAAEQALTSVPARRIAAIALFVAAFIIMAAPLFRRVAWVRSAAAVVVLISALLQAAAFAALWIAAGRVPMASSADAMALMSLILSLLLAVAMLRKGAAKLPSPPLAAVTLMAATTAMVASFTPAYAALAPVAPVLASPWLSVHVATVMAAYSLLAAIAAISAAGLAVRQTAAKRYAATVMALLYPALLLLILGIATGALWAGDAWGRPWAWDPKETWALITLMVYLIPLHVSFTPKHLMAFSLAALIVVAMTYWGVNYLPSLHAYQ